MAIFAAMALLSWSAVVIFTTAASLSAFASRPGHHLNSSDVGLRGIHSAHMSKQASSQKFDIAHVEYWMRAIASKLFETLMKDFSVYRLFLDVPFGRSNSVLPRSKAQNPSALEMDESIASFKDTNSSEPVTVSNSTDLDTHIQYENQTAHERRDLDRVGNRSERNRKGDNGTDHQLRFHSKSKSVVSQGTDIFKVKSPKVKKKSASGSQIMKLTRMKKQEIGGHHGRLIKKRSKSGSQKTNLMRAKRQTWGGNRGRRVQERRKSGSQKTKLTRAKRQSQGGGRRRWVNERSGSGLQVRKLTRVKRKAGADHQRGLQRQKKKLRRLRLQDRVPDPTPPPPEWGKKNEILACIECYQSAFKAVMNSPPFHNYDKVKKALTHMQNNDNKLFNKITKKIMSCVKKGLSATFKKSKRWVGYDHGWMSATRDILPFGKMALKGSLLEDELLSDVVVEGALEKEQLDRPFPDIFDSSEQSSPANRHLEQKGAQPVHDIAIMEDQFITMTDLPRYQENADQGTVSNSSGLGDVKPNYSVKHELATFVAGWLSDAIRSRATKNLVRPAVRAMIGDEPIKDLEDLRRRFLRWWEEVRAEKSNAFLKNRLSRNADKNQKWVVLENKNSEHILRRLQTKVESKTKPWDVFAILDVCAAKRKIKPLKPTTTKATTATTPTTLSTTPVPPETSSSSSTTPKAILSSAPDLETTEEITKTMTKLMTATEGEDTTESTSEEPSSTTSEPQTTIQTVELPGGGAGGLLQVNRVLFFEHFLLLHVIHQLFLR